MTYLKASTIVTLGFCRSVLPEVVGRSLPFYSASLWDIIRHVAEIIAESNKHFDRSADDAAYKIAL